MIPAFLYLGRDDQVDYSVIRKINKHIVHDDGTIDGFEKQLMDLKSGRFDTRFPLVIAKDSSALHYIDNFPIANPLIMNVSTVIKLKEKHDLGYYFISECENFLRESVLAFDSIVHETSRMIVLDKTNKDGLPIIAVCRNNKNFNPSVTVNEITSIYDKHKLTNLILKTYESGKKIYTNKKTEQYVKSIGFYFPKDLTYALSNNYSRSSFTKSQVLKRFKKEAALS